MSGGAHNPFPVSRFSTLPLGGAIERRWVENTVPGDTDFGAADMHLRAVVQRPRLFLLMGCIVLAFCILLVHVAMLQIGLGGKYRALAEGNSVRSDVIPADRGIVYDSRGTALVNNAPAFSLYVTVGHMGNEKQVDEIMTTLAHSIGEQKEVLMSKIVTDNTQLYFTPQPIVRSLDHNTTIKLSTMLDALPGVSLQADTKRVYPLSPLIPSLSHVLGYTGKLTAQQYKEKRSQGYEFSDNIGRTGLEFQYESLLRGENGVKKFEIDAMGREKRSIADTAAQAGAALHITIDAALTQDIERILRERLPKGKKASVVVMNPRTGGVRALVSWPGFDNNLFSGGISQDEYARLLNDPDRPLFNRAVSGEFPPGSTIKPLMVYAGVEGGVVNDRTTVMSTGGLRVGQWYFPDWKAGGHGITNAAKAIAESVNSFFYVIGGGYGGVPGLGLDKITEAMKEFGLGKRLGIDIPGESRGFVPSAQWKRDTFGESWYIGDTYHLSIGQGFLTVTPLQVAEITNFFAAGGIMYQPHVLDYYVTADGQRHGYTPVPLLTAKNKDAIRLVQEGMRLTVTGGSARSLNTLPFEVAGKTGTAQWHSTKPTHAWFTGYAPFQDPEVSVTVLVEEGGEGSSVSVPIAREILENYFKQK